ncbi:MAG: DUF1592 domain-containing protein, partial [Verrucomicrobiae bacterium]|nr:DUF1592 domain-containing protein [Verrucomicrobiae bacterium]
DTLESAELWQKVLNMLNSGEMPPEDEKQLTDAEKTDFLADLSGQLALARKALSDSGGVITMRRLNRREYENTIEDLLGVKIHAADLPDDANPGGFDTDGSAQFFSSDQFEQYLLIAERALDLAMVSGDKPAFRSDRYDMKDLVIRDFRRTVANPGSGQLGDARNTTGKKAEDFTVPDMIQVFKDSKNYRWLNHIAYLQNPDTENGAVIYNWFNNFALPDVKLPEGSLTQKFIIRVRAAVLNDNIPEHRRYLEYGSVSSESRRGELNVQGYRKVNGTMEQPEIIEFEYTPWDTNGLSLRIRERHINELNAAKRFFRTSFDDTGLGPPPALWVDWVEVDGPIIEQWPPASHQTLFINREPGLTDEQYHQAVLENFTRRAFRTQKPSPSFIDKLMALYREEIRSGMEPLQAFKEQLAIVLASPGFLYLNEPTYGERRRDLTDDELAVRLAYFLWSGPPDEELKHIAAKGQLKHPANLKRQTLRMLRDPRAEEFVSGFAHQWLHMDRLDFFQFNYEKYPLYDDSLKETAREEVYATIKDAIREHRSLGELLKSDHVMVNNLLAGYYGIQGVEGEEFRRVLVPEHLPRGGFLGMTAIMAMGSDGERSSPVERGAWIMRCLLNDAPPPAPANVPQLSRLNGQFLSAREMQKAHQEEPQCAQCHRKIDPLGFGLENFNAVGSWRDLEIVQGPTVEVDKAAKKPKSVQKEFPI